VIESVLFFILGFLTAGFLALMVAPAIWRRAVALTRRRIEASVPLSLADIQADKDRMRAEFAMSTRRLEMSIKSLKEKTAAQLVEINRGREELKRLTAERDGQDQVVSELEAKVAGLRAELGRREDQLRELADRLAEAERLLEERTLELEKMGRAYDEASLSASNRQIELVVRETEVEKLAGDFQLLRGQHKEAEQRMRDLAADGKAARDALKAERKKVTEIEKKLERNERELARLREQVEGNVPEDDLNAKLVEAQKEKAELEAKLADVMRQITTLLSDSGGGDMEKAVTTLAEDRSRLEARLTALTRENRRLKSELAAHERAEAADWDDERQGNALLREQIYDLAAEVVALTAKLEGPDSPINKALATPAKALTPAGPHEKITSLAERVRALQKGASAG
jgi:hypothetical protein